MKVINGLKKKSEKVITKVMISNMAKKDIQKLYLSLRKRNNLNQNQKEIKEMVIARYKNIKRKEQKKNEKKYKKSK